jgi:hypothetical protein
VVILHKSGVTDSGIGCGVHRLIIPVQRPGV